MNRIARMNILVLALLVVSSAWDVTSVWATDVAGPPNVLFLLTDDQRPDTIAALGNTIIKTPHLDWLVKHGTSFTRATCANPICTPSRAEILTGASGFDMGVRDFGGRISPDSAIWGKTMQAAGYDTGYVGKWHNDDRPSSRGYTHAIGLFSGGGGKFWQPMLDWNGRPVTGYRGWIFQTDDRQLDPSRGIGLTPNISGHFADAAIEFVGRKRKQPFFLHVNFTAPHDPLLMPLGYETMYDPRNIPLPPDFLAQHPFDHGNFEGRDERLFEWPRTPQMVKQELAVYYAVISHLDAQIGRVLTCLRETGQLQNTLIIFTSDHGLAVGSHGLRGKQSMYEHTIGVPLIFSGPTIPQDRRSSAQCYLRDLIPTVCDLAAIKIPKQVTGRSLKPVLAGDATQVRPEVFGYFRNVQRMIRTNRWKFISYPQVNRTQLFDLKHDPHELHDLTDVAEHAAIRKQLETRLRAWQDRVGDTQGVRPKL
ncbi:MAG: sulfatase-like hydrolase/transferase, partial [Planctomycetota bacterium]|nr:sulfatase-like hydrolase/transferase [Planctomycetota bacterium]